MDQGTLSESEDKQSCHSCMRHFACFIILPSTIKIFLKVAELCSGAEMLTPGQPLARPPTFIVLIVIIACHLGFHCYKLGFHGVFFFSPINF